MGTTKLWVKSISPVAFFLAGITNPVDLIRHLLCNLQRSNFPTHSCPETKVKVCAKGSPPPLLCSAVEVTDDDDVQIRQTLIRQSGVDGGRQMAN